MSKMRGAAWQYHARALATCGLLLLYGASGHAVTLSSQSSVAITSQYASNPFMLSAGAQPAESTALEGTLPATYTSDTQTIDIIPRFRFAESYGPTALLSNYEYVDGDWHWSSERNTLTLAGFWHHDTTYYNQFENAALLGHDVQHLEKQGSLSWQRALDERSYLQVSGSWDDSAYGQSAILGVSAYTYVQGALEYQRALNELWQSTTTIGYGRYALSNGSYSSVERFAQTALQRTLSERWSLSAQAGYVYLSARAVASVCCQVLFDPTTGLPYLQNIPIEESSSKGTPSFLLNAEHRDERLVIDLSVSRAINASGLGGLLTEDDASIGATMPWTERLTVGGTLHWSQLQDTLGRLNLGDRKIYDLDLSADWQWTEKWTTELRASYQQQYLTAQTPAARGVTVYVSLLRQFGRLRL
jgi:hypothetical protein